VWRLSVQKGAKRSLLPDTLRRIPLTDPLLRGAATCTELTAQNVPALFIPLPTATRDHQTANATTLSVAGAADVMPQAELSSGAIANYIRLILTDLSVLARMKAAAAAMPRGSGAVAVADLVESVGLARS
jgi:UDP-N-acetylglucosamine--N-acetylmuramyl-(pentapeptide) pyrophosphoryl-undecaprenol N-acetylglucosamine transferase